MPMKKHKPEQIVALLRQIEVEMANGKTTPQENHGVLEGFQQFANSLPEYRTQEKCLRLAPAPCAVSFTLAPAPLLEVLEYLVLGDSFGSEYRL